MNQYDTIMGKVNEVLLEYYGDWQSFRPDHPTNAKFEVSLFIRLMTEALNRAGITPTAVQEQ